MTRFILLSSFILAFVSTHGVFTSVSADPVASKGIVLKNIDRAAVIGNHPEAGVVDPKSAVGCPAGWGSC